jgi:hypothetical protein
MDKNIYSFQKEIKILENKRDFFIVVIVLTIIFSFLFIFHTANADVTQLSSPLQSGDIGQSAMNESSSTMQTLGKNLTGNLDQLKVYFSTGGGLGPTTAAIRVMCFNDAGYQSFNTGCSSGIATTVLSQNTSKTLKTMVSSTNALSFDKDKYYGIKFGCTANCSGGTNPPLYTWTVNVPSSYSNGDFAHVSSTDVYFELLGSVSSIFGSANLVWPPANSASSTLPDFDNWAVLVSNPTAGFLYYMHVNYSLLTSSDPLEPANSFKTYDDYSSVLLTETTSSLIWTFPKFSNLTPSWNDTIYKWKIDFSFSAVSTFDVILSSSTRNVYINYFSAAPTSTYSIYAGNFTSTSTFEQIGKELSQRFAIQGCDVDASSTYSIWSPTDWRCMFLLTIYDVASSTTSYAVSGMFSLWDRFTNIFPLNIIKTINSDINQLTSSSTPDINIVLAGAGMFNGRSFNIYSSSTTAWINDDVGFDYKGLFDKILYFITGGIIVFTTIKLIKSLHRNI